MRTENILVIGATSAIAEALARRWAKSGRRFVLVGRRPFALANIAADLFSRGASFAEVLTVDLADLSQHAAMLESAKKMMGGRIDIALVAHGTLSDQSRADVDPSYALAELNTNAVSAIQLIGQLAMSMKADGGGHIVAISSVAGDRGRASNALYGSAKAAVSAFASGVGQRFRKHGVVVTLVKPGFVDTPMTADFRKGLLWASADEVAACIEHAVEKKKAVVYAPRFWWAIMAVTKAIPESIFRRLTL